jgi:hypothetical protein
MLLMNARSYTFQTALQAAKLFKMLNPRGWCLVGGMHCTVSLPEVEACMEFDRICQGGGENIIVDLVTNTEKFPRVIKEKGAASLGDWPMIDRTVWPKGRVTTDIVRYGPADVAFPGNGKDCWPLEESIGWGPSPAASIITNRTCPWQCVFCSEASFIPHMGRLPVDRLIEELNELDDTYGPLGSVVFHDSMYFQQPKWLKEFIEKYPTKCHKPWPFWAAARADTVRKWPDLFERLVRECNWHCISIGFESGSTRTLKILNKECTAEDNFFTIDLLNRIGDDFEARGYKAPYFWSNIMYGIPGELPEDAFETQRMLRFMKRKWIAPAYYAPYAGAVLGHQLIAEGKSLMGNRHLRYPGMENVKGVDYQFYADLHAGKYEAEIASKLWAPCYTNGAGGEGLSHEMFVFSKTTGKKTVAYGVDAKDALDILSQRLTPLEMAEVIPGSEKRITQKTVRELIPELG